MYNNLRGTINDLNSDVKNVANCEKAHKLRKKSFSIGLPMAIIGFAGVLTCFILFATAGMDAVSSSGFTSRIIVPFVLFVPCGVLAGIGTSIVAYGLKIIVTGYTTKLIQETVGNNCPSCGENLTQQINYCPKCGTKILKECLYCKHKNSLKNEYCEKCGDKLD